MKKVVVFPRDSLHLKSPLPDASSYPQWGISLSHAIKVCLRSSSPSCQNKLLCRRFFHVCFLLCEYPLPCLCSHGSLHSPSFLCFVVLGMPQFKSKKVTKRKGATVTSVLDVVAPSKTLLPKTPSSVRCCCGKRKVTPPPHHHQHSLNTP